MSVRWLSCLLIGLLFATVGVGVSSGDPVHVEDYLGVNINLVSDPSVFDSSANAFLFDVSSGDNVTTFTAEYISGDIPDYYHWILKNGTTGEIIDETPVDYPLNTFMYIFPYNQPGFYTLNVNASNLTGNFRNIPVNARAIIPVKGNVRLHPHNGDTFSKYEPWKYWIEFEQTLDSAINESYEYIFGDGKTKTSLNYIESYTYPNKLGETYHGQVIAKNKTPDLFPNFIGYFDLKPIPPPIVDFNITNISSGEIISKGPAPLEIWLESNCSWPYYGDQYPYNPVLANYGWNWTTGECLNNVNGFYDPHHIPGDCYPIPIIYASPGVYNITHYFAANFEDEFFNPLFDFEWIGNKTTKQLLVYDPIIPDFTYSIESCAFPLKIKFKDNSTGSHIDRWWWDFDDGNTKETRVNTTEHTYHDARTYMVNMTVFNDTYKISEYHINPVIAEGLLANFTYTPPRETKKGTPEIVQFNSSSHGVDTRTLYLWEFEKEGHIYQNISKNATMSYSNQGLYNVTLTVTKQSDDQCNEAQNSTRKQIRIREILESRFTYYQLFGTDAYTVQFKDESTDTPTQRLWKFYHRDGINYDTTFDNPEPKYTYPEPGSYRVVLSVVNDQGTSPKDYEQWITVYENIRADFDPNVTKGVSPLMVKFTDKSIPSESITGWTWNFGDGITNTSKEPEHLFRVPDGEKQKQFMVNLTVCNLTTGATNNTIKFIDVIQPITANFAPNTTNYPMNKSIGVKFTDLSIGNITCWNWNFGDGTTNQTQNPTHVFLDFKPYLMNLTVRNDYYGISDKMDASINITREEYPEIEFDVIPPIVDPGLKVRFEVTKIRGTNVSTPIWDFGDNSSLVTSPGPEHIYTKYGKFNVTATVTGDYGTDTDIKVVGVRGLHPDFTIVPSGGWAVVNTPVTFVDNSEGNPIRWRWDFGDKESQGTNEPYIVHSYTKEGTYLVNMTAWNWEVPSREETAGPKTITIINKTVPQGVDFEVPELQYSGKAPFEVQFEDKTPSQANVTGWFWEFGDGTNSFEQVPPPHRYENPGQYTVTLTVRNEVGTNEKRRVAYVVVVK